MKTDSPENEEIDPLSVDADDMTDLDGIEIDDSESKGRGPDVVDVDDLEEQNAPQKENTELS